MNAAPSPAVPSFYGPTAEATAAAAFDAGRPPTADAPLDAPVDQHAGVLRLVADRTGGDAAPLVAPGAYAYRQAAALAKGGKVAALSFDPATELVRCDSPAGITAVIRHAQTVWAEGGGADREGGGGLFGAVRSAAGAGAGAVGWAAGKVFGTVKGKLVGRAVRGVVGRNPAGLIVAAGPSVYRALVTGEVSVRQATKDLFEAGTTVAGAAGGAAVGAAMGATVGSIVPVFGTLIGGAAGGLAGGLLGGGAGERGGELIADSFAPDDADALRPLLADELADLAFARALVPSEVARLKAAAEAAQDAAFLRRSFVAYREAEEAGDAAAARAAVRRRAREAFAPLAEAITADRAPVPPPPAG